MSQRLALAVISFLSFNLKFAVSQDINLTRYPYIQKPTTTSVVIAWKTEEASDSVVEYGTTTAYGLMVSEPTMTTQHAVMLTGLASDTTYYYRVSSGGVVLAEGDSFHTHRDESNPNFTFVAFGDISNRRLTKLQCLQKKGRKVNL